MFLSGMDQLVLDVALIDINLASYADQRRLATEWQERRKRLRRVTVAHSHELDEHLLVVQVTEKTFRFVTDSSSTAADLSLLMRELSQKAKERESIIKEQSFGTRISID